MTQLKFISFDWIYDVLQRPIYKCNSVNATTVFIIKKVLRLSSQKEKQQVTKSRIPKGRYCPTKIFLFVCLLHLILVVIYKITQLLT